MLILDSTTRKWQVKLGGSATTQLIVSYTFYDFNALTLAPVGYGTGRATSNDTTAVDLSATVNGVAAATPADGAQRKLIKLLCENIDSAAQTLKLIFNDNGTSVTEIAVLLAVGDQLIYDADGGGFRVLDPNGSIKQSANGTLPDPVTVAHGGTGDTSLTAYAPLFGGTTSTGAVQSGAVGTAGQVMTSNGAGAIATFQAGGTGVNGLGTRLTADVTESAAALASLSDLSVTLAAGGKYTGRLVLKCVNSQASEGLKLDFAGGSATMTGFWAGGGVLASGGTDAVGTNISTSLGGVINFTILTGESIIVIEFALVVNAGGTFYPRFAENSHVSGTATARLGSYMILDQASN